MTFQPKIFISHSLHQEKQVLKELCRQIRSLDKIGFQSFIDINSIKSGDFWRELVFGALGNCHGGVVLLNERALFESDWVYFEAIIMRWRMRFENRFKLLLIGIGNISKEHLKGKWEILQFQEIHWATAKGPKDIIKEIKSWLVRCRCDWPASLESDSSIAPFGLKLLLQIRYILEELDVSNFNRLASKMDQFFIATEKISLTEVVTKRYSQADYESNIELLARNLINFGLEAMHPLVENLKDPLIVKQQEIERNSLCNLLAYLTSTWVDIAASQPLAETTCAAYKGNRVFCIDGDSTHFLTPCYIRQASGDYFRKNQLIAGREGLSTKWEWIEIFNDGSEITLLSLVDEILAELYRIVPALKDYETKLSRKLQNGLTNENREFFTKKASEIIVQYGPVFIALDPGLSKTPGLAERLCEYFPTYPFILLTGKQSTSGDFKQFHFLTPELHPNGDIESKEDLFQKHYYEIVKIIST